MAIVKDCYLAAVNNKEIQLDASQMTVVNQLDNLYQQLVHFYPNGFNPIASARAFLLRHIYKRQGLYIYGGVGRGKTYIVDLFFKELPIKQKMRIHFHHFMAEVHAQLALLDGHSNPLRLVAKHFAKQAVIICFDEFFVSDIADAMLLGKLLQQQLMQLAHNDIIRATTITVLGRLVSVVAYAKGVIWFEFKDLCASPRSAADYIEIANSFNTLILTNIPIFTENDEDSARRFIALIDELYECRVKLLVSAAANIEKLYTGNLLQFEFQRVISRVTEMGGKRYLAQAHLISK